MRLPRGLLGEILRLHLVGKLDRLHVAPGVEDLSGFPSGVGVVVQDHAPIVYLLQHAAQPCACCADAQHNAAPDPRFWGRVSILLLHHPLPFLIRYRWVSYPPPDPSAPVSGEPSASPEREKRAGTKAKTGFSPGPT